jgi:hypothetical protein
MHRTLGVGWLLCVLGLAGRADALTIITPVSGAPVPSGQLVTVRVAPSPGETLASVRIGTRESQVDATPAAADGGTFEAQVRIPRSAVGPEFIVATADLADGRLSSTHVDVLADPGPLRELVVVQPPALTFVGQVLQLEVSGVFEDGVVRDLTSPDAGTRYETSDATVLGIDPSGLVQARRNGAASVRVRSLGLVATAAVPVALPSVPNNSIPIADPGPDRVAAPLTIVSLSAAASTDADGDALSYLWEQQSGPWISLRSPTSPTPSFLSPAVTGETVMEFSLTVRDSRGATSFPKLQRITVRP